MPEDAWSILVVEDDDDVREMIGAVLADNGFRVETAVTGLEAIAIIEEKPFDLVIADIRLPGGLFGLEMIRHARQSRPLLKCLFISGQAKPVVSDPMLDDFIAKPFRTSDLLGRVWRALGGNLPPPRLDIAW